MKNEAEIFSEWMQGDQMATAFCLDVAYVAHLWDDLVDKDKPREAREIDNAFTAALVTMPANPFYQRFSYDLRPVMMNAILQWQAANVLEQGEKSDRDKAYMLRASIYQIFHYCAYLVGGLEWAWKIGPDIWRYYSEDIDTYLEKKNA